MLCSEKAHLVNGDHFKTIMGAGASLRDDFQKIRLEIMGCRQRCGTAITAIAPISHASCESPGPAAEVTELDHSPFAQIDARSDPVLLQLISYRPADRHRAPLSESANANPWNLGASSCCEE